MARLSFLLQAEVGLRVRNYMELWKRKSPSCLSQLCNLFTCKIVHLQYTRYSICMISFNSGDYVIYCCEWDQSETAGCYK